MLLNCGVGEDSWESLGLKGDPTSPPERKSVLNIYWKNWCWRWNSNTLATWCEERTHLKRPWCWERLKAGGKGDDREWDSLKAPLTQWRWVLVDSRSWRWTGRAGMLQSVGLQSQTQLSDWTELLNVLVSQLCLTLWDPIDYSLPGSSDHGILQARILEWVAIPLSRESPWPRDWTLVFCIAGWFFTVWATQESPCWLPSQLLLAPLSFLKVLLISVWVYTISPWSSCVLGKIKFHRAAFGLSKPISIFLFSWTVIGSALCDLSQSN